jgi:peptidyl-prolyl cis-trans isomerase C
MRGKQKRNYFILLCFILTTVCFAVASTGASETKKQDEKKDKKVVARVNGKPIYDDRLASDVKKALKKFKKYGMKKESPEMIKRLQLKALDKVIVNELITQESQELTIKDLDAKVEQKLKTIKRKYPDREQFEKYLKVKKLTIKSLKKLLRENIRTNEYLKKQGISEPEIPEKAIKDFYESSPDSYKREETIKVSHILIKVDENATSAEKKKAREKAERIRKEVLGGKDFAEMAKEHSDCNSASGGGSLRYIKRGYMPEEFDKVAFALKKGAMSDLVETKFGYHIIKVFEKTPGGVAPYHEVKDFIRKFFQMEESKKKLAEHIAELKKKAKIEILLNEQ